jgi:hypothetical protein
MTKLIHNVTAGLKTVHQQEEGMEAMQTVLVTTLAVVILAFAFKMFAGDGQTTNGDGGGIGGMIGGLVGDAVGGFGSKIGSLIGL